MAKKRKKKRMKRGPTQVQACIADRKRTGVRCGSCPLCAKENSRALLALDLLLEATKRFKANEINTLLKEAQYLADTFTRIDYGVHTPTEYEMGLLQEVERAEALSAERDRVLRAMSGQRRIPPERFDEFEEEHISKIRQILPALVEGLPEELPPILTLPGAEEEE